jgi:pimeloyl-ACP methyl ester carboxylesterase
MLYYKTYRQPGSAEWVVFIHGAGGSSSIWFKQVKEFREHFNVLLIDLRGHGKSKDERNKYKKYTFQEISHEILDVLDHLKIKSAHFIGISLGTIIIRTIGELQPGRLKSMVLGGAITRLTLFSNFLMHFGNATKRILPYMWLYSMFAFIIMPRKRHKASRLLFVNEARKLAQKEFLRWYKLTAEVNPLLRYFKEKDLKVPTLYLMGEEDHMFLEPVRRIVRVHSSSWLDVVPNSGHVVNVDQPDYFNRKAIGFIKENSR